MWWSGCVAFVVGCGLNFGFGGFLGYAGDWLAGLLCVGWYNMLFCGYLVYIGICGCFCVLRLGMAIGLVLVGGGIWFTLRFGLVGVNGF